MSEQTERHEGEREVERTVEVDKPDGTQVDVDTERETEHTHTRRKQEGEADEAEQAETPEQ